MDMAHGYLEDGYGIDGGVDRNRDDDREHRWRDRDRREHGWQGSDDRADRDRGMMFADREHGAFGDRSAGRRSFSASPDDHYRSWRDRHMSELDRDYADYCREREQQFHSDFDAWRRQRHASYQPLRTGMTNSGLSHDPSGQVQEATEGAATSEDDAMSAATLGTNDEAQSGTGRGRR
jgi:hypothetical protein